MIVNTCSSRLSFKRNPSHDSRGTIVSSSVDSVHLIVWSAETSVKTLQDAKSEAEDLHDPEEEGQSSEQGL